MNARRGGSKSDQGDLGIVGVEGNKKSQNLKYSIFSGSTVFKFWRVHIFKAKKYLRLFLCDCFSFDFICSGATTFTDRNYNSSYIRHKSSV